jgi:hypothetical protein
LFGIVFDPAHVVHIHVDHARVANRDVETLEGRIPMANTATHRITGMTAQPTSVRAENTDPPSVCAARAIIPSL